ncbi:MAG TPA: hypothetical protein PKG67_12460, partial [Turneriella sp.]|nr:hypothetical protein [Turneriella sp.]
MKKITAFALAALFVAGQVQAQSMKTHTDRKAGFSIKQPTGWKLTKDRDGVNATIATKDNLAMVQVIRADVDAGTTTDAFLHEVEKQIGETLLLHKGLRGNRLQARIVELLELVGLPDAAQRLVDGIVSAPDSALDDETIDFLCLRRDEPARAAHQVLRHVG